MHLALGSACRPVGAASGGDMDRLTRSVVIRRAEVNILV